MRITPRLSAMKGVIPCCAMIAFLAQGPEPVFPQGRLSTVYPEDSRPPLAFRRTGRTTGTTVNRWRG